MTQALTKKYYAGIGSKKTPPEILDLMTRIAKKLNEKGYVLRSGGAAGADRAFERGTGVKEIFLAGDATEESIEMTKQYHPAWHRCSSYARSLHGRNCMILFGRTLDVPVEFVICYSPNGETVGGTGQGIRIAEAKGIRVTNLGTPEGLHKAIQFLKS